MHDLWGWIQIALAVLMVLAMGALMVCGVIANRRLRARIARGTLQQLSKEPRFQKRTAINNLPANADESH